MTHRIPPQPDLVYCGVRFLRLILLITMFPALAAAQTAPAPTAAGHPTGVLARTDFSFLAGFLFTSDPRFSYTGKLTADLDVVDYGKGRTNVFVDYEMGVGHERRAFDVNHGNYTIEGSTSIRLGRLEIAPSSITCRGT